MFQVSKRISNSIFLSLSLMLPIFSFAADDGSQQNEKFRINYAGYLPQASKTALYLSSNSGPITWSITSSDCTGIEDTYVSNDVSSGDSFYIIDFSQCTELLSNSRIQVGSDQSQPFSISNDPYGNIKYEFFDYFKDHEANANFDQAVNNWERNLNISFNYVKDAGDDGAYPTNTAEASWALINMLETYPEINTYYSSNFSGAKTVFDQLEVLTEQFYHVFDHSGSLAIPKFHTNVNDTWALCSPHSSGTCISEPETKATFAAARTLAAMARLRLDYANSNNANTSYELAKTAYSNASSNAVVCNQADSFGGEGGYYPDNDNYSIYRDPKSSRDHCVADQNNTEDDQYASLVELYLAATKLGNTADANTYRSQVISHARFNEASSYSWSSVVMEGNLSLLVNEPIHNIDLSTLKENILIKSDQIIQNQQQGYPGVTWDANSNQWDNGDQNNADNNVRWGSHRNALNDARILMAASEIERSANRNTQSANYARFAIQVMDHISGVNAMALTMYTTSGYSQFEHSIERTHDGADPTDSWAGKMVLGPNNWTNANDSDMPEFNSQAGLKMFAVTGVGWASREISIDANASLVPVAYFTAEVAPQILALAPIGGLPEPVNSPSAVQDVNAINLEYNSVTLNWSDTSGANNDNAIEFLIYQNTANSQPINPVLSVSSDQNSVDIGDLNAQTQYYFWVEASNAVGVSPAVSVQVTTQEKPPLENLIQNGDFSDPLESWICSIDTGDASCEIFQNTFLIDIIDGSTLDWHVQALYSDLSLLNGQTYTLSFDAKAQSTRSAAIKIERSEDPWDDFTQIGVGQNLTDQMQRFSYTFTMTETVNNARLAVNVGADNNPVTVDNIWLANTDSDPCVLLVGCGENVPDQTFTLTVSQPLFGAISPTTMSVFEGESQVFNITADLGYKVSNVFVNDVSQGAVNTVTLNAIYENYEITAIMEPVENEQSLINVIEPINGSISPGSTYIELGSNIAFQITPDDGYKISQVIKNGVNYGEIESISFDYLETQQELQVLFSPAESINYLVNVDSGINGSSNIDSQLVNAGDNISLIFTPNAGYEIADVLVNFVSQGAENSIELNNIQANQNIQVLYQQSTLPAKTYSVSASTNLIGGSLSQTSASVIEGADFEILINVEPGYQISSIVKNGQLIAFTDRVTFTNIMSDQVLYVEFREIDSTPSIQTAQINVVISGLGTVSPDIDSIEFGDSVSFNIDPYNGHELESVYVNDILINANEVLTINNVQQDQNILVNFKLIEKEEPEKWFTIGDTQFLWLFLIGLGVAFRFKKN